LTLSGASLPRPQRRGLARSNGSNYSPFVQIPFFEISEKVQKSLKRACNGFSKLSFFEVDNLLAYGNEDSFLIPHFKFNQTDSVGSMSHLGCGLEGVSRFTSSQEMNILLERDGWLSKAVSRCFTGLVSDGKDSSSMSHLVDIDGFLSNGKSGTGETREEFNQFHSYPLGESVFAIDFIEDGLQDVFRGFIHKLFFLISP
jgi:hypothetical protein